MPTTARRLALVLVLAAAAPAAAALAGCGPTQPTASDEIALTVTRDFGRTSVAELRRQPVPRSPQLARILERYARAGARQSLFVNGILADAPAARLTVHGGDRVWLDQHRMTIAAAEIPAVVGSFPEPFLHGAGGKRLPVRVECDDPRAGPCAAVADKLVALGVVAGRSVISRSAADETLRVVVGPWKRLRGRDLEADSLDAGPRASGVFARFDETGARLEVLDAAGDTARTLGAATGLIAATRAEQRQPLWFVTGTDEAGVAAAARAFDESVLADRFALAIAADLPVAIPQP